MVTEAVVSCLLVIRAMVFCYSTIRQEISWQEGRIEKKTGGRKRLDYNRKFRGYCDTEHVKDTGEEPAQSTKC